MKIAFVIESMGIGGAEQSLLSLLKNYDFGSDEVHLFLIHTDGKLIEKLPDFVKINQIKRKEPSIYQRLRFFIARKTNFKKMHHAQIFWTIMSNNFPETDDSYDVAIAYSQGFSTYYVAEKFKSKKKIAWNNVDFIEVGYKPYFDSRFYQKFDYIALVSENSKKRFNSTFDSAELNKKARVVYDITDVDAILEKSNFQQTEIRQTDTINLLTAGRMEAVKGYDIAIETAQLLKQNSVSFHWYFLGDGSQRKSLETMVSQMNLENEISFLGRKENPYPYMKACDIYVQPSRHEGWGLTLVEAKVLGKPAVSTNFPTASEILNENENGLIAEMNPVSLSKQIKRLIQDNQLRQKLSADIIQQTENRKRETLETIKTLFLKI